MKVAFTSTNGKTINIGFGKSYLFQVWDINAEGASKCPSVGVIATHRSKEENSLARVNAVANCVLVCTLEMGDSTTAKLVTRGIHPLKTRSEISIQEMIEKLQTMLKSNPPPWMRRTLGKMPSSGLSS